MAPRAEPQRNGAAQLTHVCVRREAVAAWDDSNFRSAASRPVHHAGVAGAAKAFQRSTPPFASTIWAGWAFAGAYIFVDDSLRRAVPLKNGIASFGSTSAMFCDEANDRGSGDDRARRRLNRVHERGHGRRIGPLADLGDIFNVGQKRELFGARGNYAQVPARQAPRQRCSGDAG